MVTFFGVFVSDLFRKQEAMRISVHTLNAEMGAEGARHRQAMTALADRRKELQSQCPHKWREQSGGRKTWNVCEICGVVK